MFSLEAIFDDDDDDDDASVDECEKELVKQTARKVNTHRSAAEMVLTVSCAVCRRCCN